MIAEERRITKMKMRKIIIYSSLWVILMVGGISFLPSLFDAPGKGQLIYSVQIEAGKKRFVERHLPFQFLFNNQSQTFSFSLGKNQKIQEVGVQFFSFWPFLLRVEEIQYLSEQGALLHRIDFTQREGGKWQMWRAEQKQYYLFSEKSLEKMAAEGLPADLLKELSMLSGQSFSSKKELHEKLKTLPHAPDWKKRGIIRGYTQQAHYWVPYNGADLISSEPPPLETGQVRFRFRPVTPTDFQEWWQYGAKSLLPLWLFGFVGSLLILGILLPKWTGRPWHLD